MSSRSAFTGRTRHRKTSPAVRWVDRAARGLIGVGGIGTIVAVLLVCVFLVAVAIPLFGRATLTNQERFNVEAGGARPVHLSVNDYRRIAWTLLSDGKIRAIRLDNGEAIGPEFDVRVVENGENLPEVTSHSATSEGEVAFGFADGSMRTGKVEFESSLLDVPEAPQALRDIGPDEVRQHEDGVATLTPREQIRLQKVNVRLDPPSKPEGEASAIVLLDYVAGNLCSLSAGGALRISSIDRRENPFTGEVTTEVDSATLPMPTGAAKPPDFLRITGLADNLFVVWKDGRTLRFGIRNFKKPVLAEEADLIPENGVTLTSLEFLIGRTTLLAGDSTGRVRAWFAARQPTAETADRQMMVAAHDFAAIGSPVTSISSSARNRTFAAGYEDGRVRLFYATSSRLLIENKSSDRPIDLVSIAPRGDGVLALTGQGISRWDFDAAHPEVTLSTLFLPVWYEGYAQPEFLWQTSSGNDEFEPKYSLTPLVFGTLKATFYSMLFGAPLALLAAIYSSEVLRPQWKARVKPVIEMMASLPSVVLGFVAGLVIAPAIEDIVPSVLASFLTVPLAFVFGAQLWRLLPGSKTIEFSYLRFPLVLFVALPLGILVGAWIGPVLERFLFAGDFKAWLNLRHGSGAPGWMIILLPLSGLTVFWLTTSRVNPWLRDHTVGWTRRQAAVASFGVFLVGSAASLLLAAAVGWLLELIHVDPRGSIVDTYVQRNALVVGFVMGFAIIPIIYTIADDALSSVPEHLRSASLGAGATPWQTATRIVIPTAMSGLFSALMIGLGRAVGETMIVLMAAGNTPIMEWNIFNGFQTLSAAIATELGEAAHGTSHYRILFLAALTLFAITFVVNTAAEVVRQRVRRRAYEL